MAKTAAASWWPRPARTPRSRFLRPVPTDNNRRTKANNVALGYDGNGNLISDGSRTYVWDDRDRLIQIKSGSTVIASFSYDALGRRIAKTEGGTTTNYLYDGLDALGSTRLLTDASGAVVQRYDYDPYGTTTQTSAGITNPYQYTGREKDQTGLYHYRARYYQPGWSRFVSEDPIGLDGGGNYYAYVEGNPVSYVDPTGEIAFVPILIGIGVGYAFDYALEQYKKAHCTCQDTPAGSIGNAAAGGAVGGAGPFASKPRGGIAGGGPSGTATYSFSQMNHAAASRGLYSVATRNGISKVLRKVPYVGAALATYEIYDALSCD